MNEALRILRERWLIVTMCLLLGILGAGAATYLSPRQYASDVTLYVSLQGQADSTDAAYQASELAKERVVSYAALLKDARITQPVIDSLQLGVTPKQLADRITVTVEPETVVLSATVTDGSPERAAAIANALAQEFVGLVQQLEQPVGPAPVPPAPAVRGQPAPAPTPTPAPTRIEAQIIRPAAPALAPVSPNPPFNIALGTAFGLLVGIAAGFVRNARDTSIRSSRRLRELSSAPVLAEIEYDSSVPRRPLTFDERLWSPRAEAFRKLRTNLQFLNTGDEYKVIVVTSGLPGEGTSTTASNLAITLAYAGNRVLLVDANLRRPRLAVYLGVDARPGLMDVLAGTMPWTQAVQRCNEGVFDLVPAGPLPPNPSELLTTRRLAGFLDEARQMYGFVIIDAPALLPVTDAAAIAARADGAILVVRHSTTSEGHVAAALGALEAVSAPLLGTVLTMTPRTRRRSRRIQSYPEPPRLAYGTPIPPVRQPEANGAPSGPGIDQRTQPVAAAPSGAAPASPPAAPPADEKVLLESPDGLTNGSSPTARPSPAPRGS